MDLDNDKIDPIFPSNLSMLHHQGNILTPRLNTGDVKFKDFSIDTMKYRQLLVAKSVHHDQQITKPFHRGN